MQQGALEGLPTQVHLAAPISAPTSQEPSSEEDDSGGKTAEDGRKRTASGSDGDGDQDASPANKRAMFAEGDSGGISKLVEFCSKDIK